MIPLGDASRRMVRFPIVTVSLILANMLVFLLELTGGDAFVTRWSMVPADIMAGKNLVTILTAMFLHAGWSHILGNMIFLWAFGPEIEDFMGRMKYAGFYLLAGLAATAAQILLDPSSTIPNLGASGAIAGVMGAFLITYPRDRIRVLFFFGLFARVAFIPSIFLVGFWFLTQLFNQLGALVTVQSGGVAYAAHIGGFIFGALVAKLMEQKNRPDIQEPF